jgi:hypothetical protein
VQSNAGMAAAHRPEATALAAPATFPVVGAPTHALEVWVARLALLVLLCMAPLALLAGVVAAASLGPAARRRGSRGPFGLLANGIVALMLLAMLSKLAGGRR